MFWKKKKQPIEETAPEPTPLVLEIIHSFETEPESWSVIWNDGKKVYAFTRTRDNNKFVVYTEDGNLAIQYAGTLVKDREKKSIGTLPIPLSQNERDLIHCGVQKLIRWNAIEHLKTEQKVPREAQPEEPELSA